ncbi:MAG: hypothetical protein KIT68_12615 [Phycisphaeraceae bacterium]|nr:hypothetical protein [Phycisphaeraceae bacterium]
MSEPADLLPDLAVPSPQRLLERWRAVSLIEELGFGAGRAVEFYTVRIVPGRGVVAHMGAGDRAAAWMAVAGGCYAFVGGWQYHPNFSRVTERRIRGNLRLAPVNVRSLLPPAYPKSMGMAFGLLSAAARGPWEDLTNADPECRWSAQFPECPLLYGSLRTAASRLRRAFGIPDAGDPIAHVLRGRPLTVAAARSLMRRFDRLAAVRAASRCGYEIDAELRV